MAAIIYAGDAGVFKTCTVCGETKPGSGFYRAVQGAFGLGSICRSCHCKRTKDRYLANLETERERRAKYNRENLDKGREAARRYREQNRDVVRANQRKCDRKRRSTPRGRLENAMAAGMHRAIRSGAKAGRPWLALVGYTANELMAHLEKQFLPGMSWDNYGEWHIDHIIPISAHNYETPEHIDFKKAWALENLQPLWASDNMQKKAKIGKPFQPSLAL